MTGSPQTGSFKADGKSTLTFRFTPSLWNSQKSPTWGCKAVNWLNNTSVTKLRTRPRCALKVISKILKLILKPTGSGWGVARILMMWWHLLKPVRSLTAAFLNKQEVREWHLVYDRKRRAAVVKPRGDKCMNESSKSQRHEKRNNTNFY